MSEAFREALRERMAAIEAMALSEVGAERKALFAYALALSHVEEFERTGVWRKVPGEIHLRLVE